jgi:hypothetical protein
VPSGEDMWSRGKLQGPRCRPVLRSRRFTCPGLHSRIRFGAGNRWECGWLPPTSHILNRKAHQAHKECLVHSESGTPTTSTEVRGRAPRPRSIRPIAPVGLLQAIAAWRRRGTDGWTMSLSAAAPLLALPVPGEEVRQKPLPGRRGLGVVGWSPRPGQCQRVRALWQEDGSVKHHATN